MRTDSAPYAPRHWALIFTIVALASVYAFLADFISPNWPGWILSPLLIFGFRRAVTMVPSDSMTRAVLYQAAFVLVPFMGVYGLVDAIFSADWVAWVVAAIVVLLLWAGVATIAEVEAD